MDNRPSIIEVISAYTTLRRSGKEYVGLCPFHTEKTPSFYVNEGKGVFHCWGCGEGGDVIAFIQKMEGLDFKGALGRLELAGTSVPWLRPKARLEKDAANIIADWAQETSIRIGAHMCEAGRRAQIAREAQAVPGTDKTFLRDEVSRCRREWLVLETMQNDLFNPALVSELWSGRESLEKIIDG